MPLCTLLDEVNMHAGAFTSRSEVHGRHVTAVLVPLLSLSLLGEIFRSDACAAGWSDAELRNIIESQAHARCESKPEDRVDVPGGVQLGGSLDKKGYQCKLASYGLGTCFTTIARCR